MMERSVGIAHSICFDTPYGGGENESESRCFAMGSVLSSSRIGCGTSRRTGRASSMQASVATRVGARQVSSGRPATVGIRGGYFHVHTYLP